MFEKVVESVLEEYVSEWVEGLDSEKMKVALFAGKVEFRDLRMRGAALDKFQLPMKMKSGSVGRLSIKVPWKRLTSQAVKIKVEDVFLVVEPTDQDEARRSEEDDDSYALRTRWAKQQEVRMLELLETVKNDGSTTSESEGAGAGAGAGAGDSDPTASWGYRKKILNTILDNVSFEFSNIHIRYEDSKHLASSIPLALGLTIDSIVISTTNANGQEEFVDRAQARTAFVHRRLEMVQASVYSDHIEAKGAQSRKGPSTSGSNVIHPFSTRINLARNHDERTASTIPKLRCSAEISAIRACLTPQQSTFLISIADFVSAHEMYLKRLHFQRKRPLVPVRSNARLWWQYALHGVLELHRHSLSSQKTATASTTATPARRSSVVHRRCSWKLFVTLWFARKEYIHLHKNMLRAAKKKKLDIESVMADRSRLNALEDVLEVPTIVFFRLCAARELELEGQGHDSPRKLSQWKSRFSSGRTSSGSSNGSASTRDSFIDKLEIYLAVNDRMHASSEARTASFCEERNVEALLMALDLVVISFEVVLVEEYKVGDKSDTRDFLRFELNEFVVTVLQRTSSSTVSSRITSVQILDFRQTYEAATLEKKEPHALLSMIDTISPNGQVVSRKNPFVELNIECSESKFQLDCVFERFRYIHNLYATSKLRAYFIARVDEPDEPVAAIKAATPTKTAGKVSKLPVELQRKASIENAFGTAKARRKSDTAAVHTREVVFSVKLPEIDVFVHTTDASAEVEARLVGTHFQNGAAHNTFELSIEGAETYFLEPEVCASTEEEKYEGEADKTDTVQRKRSTLMQSTRLVFYGEKLVEGYLVPKWQMKCTAPPIQFSMSSKQYQQLLQASAEWQSPKQGQEAAKAGSIASFIPEDERFNVCFSIPQILIDFNGEGPIQTALSAASSASEEITGFELDIRDLNVMARFSSAAQAAAVDMGLLSLVKCVKYSTVPDNTVDGSSADDASAQNADGPTPSSIPPPLPVAKTTADPVFHRCTGYRTCKLLELSGKTSVMISSSEPLMGEINVEQAALYWDHELLVALVRYHSKAPSAESSASGPSVITQSDALEPLACFALQVKVQRYFAFFMPKACWQERVSFGLCGSDLRCDVSTLQTQYVCATLEGIGEIQLTASRLNQIKSENDSADNEAQSPEFSEETSVLLQARTPVRVVLESAGFSSLEHRGGAASYYRIESEDVEMNYLRAYWSPFLDHLAIEIGGFSRWTDLLRMPPGMKALNDRVSVELDISHVTLKLPTCEAEGKHKSPSDHIEIDVRNVSAASRAYPEDTTQEQSGIQAGSVQLFTVMTKPQRPNQAATNEESKTDEQDELPVCRYSVGKFSDLFIEYVALPLALTNVKGGEQEEMKPSALDLAVVIAEMERMCSRIKVELWSTNNWMKSGTKDQEETDATPADNSPVTQSTTTLAFNPYQLELLSRVLDNNFVGSPPAPVCSFVNADETKVSDMEFDFGDLALDLLDPLDPSVDDASSGNPSSGAVIARACLERFQLAADGFASLRSQYRASSSKGSLWKIDWSEDEAQEDVPKSEVRALCGSIFSLSEDVSKQGIDIILDRRAPSPEVAIPPTEVRIHLDNCELLPLIVEFGQRLRYFASIESDLSEQIERAETSLDVSITTGFVHYLAAECVPNSVDELGSEDEDSQRLHSDATTLKMIASGCIVGRYHSDEPENSRTQLYGRNMCVKVSSQWPPQPAVLTVPASPSSQSESPTKADMSGALDLSRYERTVCDDFTIDLELVTAEDAEATMAVTLTHFHAVVCTLDLFLFSQAQKVFGTDNEASDSSSEKEKTEETETSEGEDGDSKPADAPSRPLAPPEIEFREDSISMVEFLLEDTSITLLRQSGPHLSPIARLYTFRAMCKATYEVGERIDGVVPTLTEVAVEFPDESLNEPCADDG
ncbi:hypothetical protein PHYSODRAFT_441359, partial [Phytophthora sojae]